MSGLKRKEKKIIADFGNGKANYGTSQNIGAGELLGKASARLPHSKSLLRNIMRDLVRGRMTHPTMELCQISGHGSDWEKRQRGCRTPNRFFVILCGTW